MMPFEKKTEEKLLEFVKHKKVELQQVLFNIFMFLHND